MRSLNGTSSKTRNFERHLDIELFKLVDASGEHYPLGDDHPPLPGDADEQSLHDQQQRPHDPQTRVERAFGLDLDSSLVRKFAFGTLKKVRVMYCSQKITLYWID